MTAEVEGGPDQGLSWHYGNPVAEARAIAAGTGVADLGNRDIFEIRGPERLSWLHSLTSQHLASLAPGEATTALILSPQGHIEHVLHGIDDGTRFLGWTEPGRGQQLVDWLTKMRFMTQVEVQLRPDLSLVWVGDQVSVPTNWPARAADIGGRELFKPVDEELPSGTPVGTWALEAARIADGIPRVFLDTDHKTIPNELGLLGTHLDKGCYRGQETVARVHTLGRPPRRLVLLHLDGSGSQLPHPGSALRLDGKDVGLVGSSAQHHELGPIALGLIKRNIPTDVDVLADGIPARQEVLLDPDVGLHVRPRLR